MTKIRLFTVPEVTDPEMKARMLKRLKGAALTYELGVATAEAGIHFYEMPYRCIGAKEFRRGYSSAVTYIDSDDLMMSEDGKIINKAIN